MIIRHAIFVKVARYSKTAGTQEVQARFQPHIVYNFNIQWNAENGKAPKTELLSVWISAFHRGTSMSENQTSSASLDHYKKYFFT